MTTYTDVFGSDTVPPAGVAYSALTLSVNTTFVWPYNAASTSTAIAKILDITCSAAVVMTFPAANLVSEGEDFLIRNVGAQTLTLNDNAGGVVTTIVAGASKYFYVSSNTTAAGAWGNVTFGAGSSSATAGDLIGYGIKAVTNTLNQSHPVYTGASNVTVDATYRAKLVVSTGGTATIALAAVATLGDDFFFLYRNEGTGSATINPSGVETFDGATTFVVQPGESLIAVCSGAVWYSVGYGRSTLYQFTQLVKDVSAAGSFTLSASEASNKLLSFTGNPAAAVTIVVPNVVAIYYVQSAISTAQTITVKTAAGTGTTVAQSAKAILICDATNVASAQTAIATGGIALDAGSGAAPSLNFSAATNTGLFLKGANGVGLSANGVEVGSFETTGLELVAPLAITEGGTGRVTSTTAYGLLAAGTVATGVQQTLAAGATTEVLVGGGAAALPVWTTATGSGAPVRATSPVLVTPALGTPTSGVATNLTGTATGLTAGNVTTNANLTGGVTSVGNATTVVTNANLTGHVTSVGNAAVLGSFTLTQLNTAVSDANVAAAGANTDITSLSAPALGAATATTAAAGDSSTKVATTAFVGGSGKVLKVQSFYDGGGSTTSVTLVNVNTAGWSYTPVSANSKLLLFTTYNFQISQFAASAYAYVSFGEFIGAVWTNFGNVGLLGNFQYSTAYAQGAYSQQSITETRTNSSLTPRSFDMMAATTNAGMSVATATMYLTIIEVAN